MYRGIIDRVLALCPACAKMLGGEQSIWLRIATFAYAGAAMFLGVVAGCLGGRQSISEEIVARKFVVVDGEGKARAELGPQANGEFGLRVWSSDRSTYTSVIIDRNGMPRVAFDTEGGMALMELGVLDKRYPVFILNGADGKRRFGLTLTDTGSPAIGLYDVEKRNRLAIRLGRHGNPQIALSDEQGTPRSRLMLDDTGMCALDLLDAKGNAHIVLQVDALGKPDVAILDVDGKPAG